ncbi:MAG: hypothetical protein AAB429_01835 [Patescibacteria group bacterium]
MNYFMDDESWDQTGDETEEPEEVDEVGEEGGEGGEDEKEVDDEETV